MIKDSSRTIISFDGQAQGQDRGILLLDNNQDSRDILLCLVSGFILVKIMEL